MRSILRLPVLEQRRPKTVIAIDYTVGFECSIQFWSKFRPLWGEDPIGVKRTELHVNFNFYSPQNVHNGVISRLRFCRRVWYVGASLRKNLWYNVIWRSPINYSQYCHRSFTNWGRDSKYVIVVTHEPELHVIAHAQWAFWSSIWFER